ncbi:2-oxoadipate dioxygenase/decarboxylase [Prescottella agglutinans]|uniref:2-oxoadipate dioxygenase/decarboxylase n=1 Tax=Prescottella agglutinans TaxID=1644129 RepID=A0ABT6M516_9NOCA|nr:VOC family protein [Prescottella agglutinans]MDH6279403.1 putative glyoxalase superfamily metalloenzyme YdcJ [Prescottella agglutinans]
MAEIHELRSRFAAALSRMYGREVPAYTTLVDVTEQVNADFLAANPDTAQRLGSIARVTAERHGAIRVGTPSEMHDVAVLFAGFGMHPVGFYDLREATPPVPVVSTAFRPIDPDELARNPFRVFTSMLTTADRRFFDADLQHRLESFLQRRRLFPDVLLALARRAADDGGLDEPQAERFVSLATAVFELSGEPVDRAWYRELEAVSAVAADIGGVSSTHINHLTPRVLDIDDLYARMSARGIAMIDRIQGPPRWPGPAVLLRQTSFRALAESRSFVERDGSITDGELRVRFGEVEARGIALTPTGRGLYDELLDSDPSNVNGLWDKRFPASEDELEKRAMAYFTYHDGVRAPIVYEDFLPKSAAGIFRSNLDRDTTAAAGESGTVYDLGTLADVIGRRVHDPYELYRHQQEQSGGSSS